VDRQMKRYGVPRICFVNKMDRAGANFLRCADMLKEKLGHHAVPIQVNMGAEEKFMGVIDPIEGKAYFFDGEKGENVRVEAVPAEYAEETKKRRELIVEMVSEVDDALAEKFIGGEEVTAAELLAAVRRATIALKSEEKQAEASEKKD
ncbi:MAG TPA: GTP-binding protein, partial [Candidatus Obscuribacter sp.]|nr:GTP-binding protein [Candidatus Obscuribacter sp.]